MHCSICFAGEACQSYHLYHNWGCSLSNLDHRLWTAHLKSNNGIKAISESRCFCLLGKTAVISYSLASWWHLCLGWILFQVPSLLSVVDRFFLKQSKKGQHEGLHPTNQDDPDNWHDLPCRASTSMWAVKWFQEWKLTSVDYSADAIGILH